MYGRASEYALLDELVSAIHRGEGRSLVLRGEAGIGKTALLEYLIASASDLTVVRAAGLTEDVAALDVYVEMCRAVRALPAPCGRCPRRRVSRVSAILCLTVSRC